MLASSHGRADIFVFGASCESVSACSTASFPTGTQRVSSWRSAVDGSAACICEASHAADSVGSSCFTEIGYASWTETAASASCFELRSRMRISCVASVSTRLPRSYSSTTRWCSASPVPHVSTSTRSAPSCCTRSTRRVRMCFRSLSEKLDGILSLSRAYCVRWTRTPDSISRKSFESGFASLSRYVFALMSYTLAMR